MKIKSGYCPICDKSINVCSNDIMCSCPDCGHHIMLHNEKKLTPMYLGDCDELDCEHWQWCGDSYDDRNTECFCRINGASVYRHEAKEKRILCPLGKTRDEDDDE